MAIADGKVSLKHLVTMETLTNEEVLGLIRRGGDFKNGRADFQLDRQYFAANLFFENSTRTHKSFEVAEKKLGLDVIEFDAGTSSVNKGETLYDTILTMSALGVDICVVRHSEVDYYKQLIDSRTIQTSIVNGGDGSGQHPSQCLLDLMTIYEEFGTFENLKICIAGDITHSRVAKSNMQILKRLGAQLYFAGPAEWYSNEFDVYGQHVAIDDVIEDLDVLMLLRVQHERHGDDKGFSKEELEKAIEEELKEKELALFVLAITDILNSNSEILVLGEKSSVVEKAFDKKLENNRAFLEGVVSRKKQLLPNIDKNI